MPASSVLGAVFKSPVFLTLAACVSTAVAIGVSIAIYVWQQNKSTKKPLTDQDQSSTDPVKVDSDVKPTYADSKNIVTTDNENSEILADNRAELKSVLTGLLTRQNHELTHEDIAVHHDRRHLSEGSDDDELIGCDGHKKHLFDGDLSHGADSSDDDRLNDRKITVVRKGVLSAPNGDNNEPTDIIADLQLCPEDSLILTKKSNAPPPPSLTSVGSKGAARAQGTGDWYNLPTDREGGAKYFPRSPAIEGLNLAQKLQMLDSKIEHLTEQISQQLPEQNQLTVSTPMIAWRSREGLHAGEDDQRVEVATADEERQEMQKGFLVSSVDSPDNSFEYVESTGSDIDLQSERSRVDSLSPQAKEIRDDFVEVSSDAMSTSFRSDSGIVSTMRNLRESLDSLDQSAPGEKEAESCQGGGSRNAKTSQCPFHGSPDDKQRSRPDSLEYEDRRHKAFLERSETEIFEELERAVMAGDNETAKSLSQISDERKPRELEVLREWPEDEYPLPPADPEPRRPLYANMPSFMPHRPPKPTKLRTPTARPASLNRNRLSRKGSDSPEKASGRSTSASPGTPEIMISSADYGFRKARSRIPVSTDRKE